MDVQTFLRDLHTRNAFPRLALNEFSQFGPAGQTYLGATILPERLVPRNHFTESGIRYKTTIANDGTRYSPAQLKGSGIVLGSFEVILGNHDIAREFTGHELDAVIEMLVPISNIQAPTGMQAAAQVLGWSQTAINMALIEKNEQQRWQAIVDASVVRLGDNKFTETVAFPAPAGHRPNAGGDWSDPTYPILTDLLAGKRLMASKGYTLNRMIGSTAVQNTMLMNTTMAQAAGRAIITVTGGGTLAQNPSAFSLSDLNTLLASHGLPQFEVYDRTYSDETGAMTRFLKEDALVMVATTGREERVASALDPTTFRLVRDTIGYYAVGRGVGQTSPGRVLQVTYHSNKPPRLEGEGWETGFPVITDPEAFYVIKSITLPS